MWGGIGGAESVKVALLHLICRAFSFWCFQTAKSTRSFSTPVRLVRSSKQASEQASRQAGRQAGRQATNHM